MTEAAAAAVNHHAHLALKLDAHLAGRPRVVDLVHHLNLGVVVACAQRPQLPGGGGGGGQGQGRAARAERDGHKCFGSPIRIQY